MDNEDEAVEFLERLDIRVNDLESKTMFANKLDKIFQEQRITFASRKQINALYPLAQKKFIDFAGSNIKRVEFQQFGRTQTRFVIPKQRGLFGFTRALKFFRTGAT